MSRVTFVNRKYSCKCGHHGTMFCVINDVRDVNSNYPSDSIPQEVKPSRLYKEEVVRDEDGIIMARVVKEAGCDSCGNLDIDVEFPMKLDDLMNFYPPGEPQKWLESFIKNIG